EYAVPDSSFRDRIPLLKGLVLCQLTNSASASGLAAASLRPMIFFKNSRFHNFREPAQGRNLGGPPSKAKLAHLCVPSFGVVAQLLGQPVHSSTQLRRR